ncbi:MAG: RluA family pseudouridine synthase [Candidatus Chisholmbacteria bacterium]|nr:RluA family pseudouridine synthase [Candidatus Chisholmbacteria bacterium]
MARILQPGVIAEDDEILVLSKPAGMTVNRAETEVGETVQDWVERKLKIINEKLKIYSSDFLKRSGIVHRLDKDTSGVLVIAKTPETFAELQRQFKAREVEKEYVALVHGELTPKQGIVRLPIARSLKDRQRFRVDTKGKKAETQWLVEGYYRRGNEVLTKVRLKPKTGRTHQLRVHLAHLGYPLVSDKRYLSKKRMRSDARFCPRQFLHAEKLCVWRRGEKQCFVASLASDLQTAMTHLVKIRQ